MKSIKISGRCVAPITSAEGQGDYYEHHNFWRTCYQNTNRLITPTLEEAREYLRLKAEVHKPLSCQDKKSEIIYHKLDIYNSRYDWRPIKSRGNNFVGLVAPTGEQLLPQYFADVFTEFYAITDRPPFIPVSNGEAWALVSLTDPPILMTDFRYNAIIPERWKQRLFFVQDNETMKWGALEITYPFLHTKPYKGSLPLLKVLMPPIADEIYEDELITEDAPTTFFMTRRGDKIGILTDFGYSDIIYDSYEAHNTKCTFQLIRNDRKRARRVDYWHPDGKNHCI